MKKITIYLILLALLTLNSCSKESNYIDNKYFSTQKVETGTIEDNDFAIGYVESLNTLKLSPKSFGRIKNIYIEVGDSVQKGQLLAELDGSEARVGYSTASNIAGTLKSIQSQTGLMFDNQIKALEYKILQVEKGNTGIEQGLFDTKKITNSQLRVAESGLKQAKAGLQTAITTLEQTNIVLKTKEKNIYKNTISSITNSVILYTNIMYFVDSFLGITDENKDKNNKFEDYISAKNTKNKTAIRIKFIDVNNLFKKYKQIYNEQIEGKKPNNEEIKDIAIKGIEVAEVIKELLNSTYNALSDSIANVYLTQSTIDSYKNTISNMGKDVEASLVSISGEYILGLKGSIENMETFSDSSKMQIALLKKQILLAEKNVDTATNKVEQYKVISEGEINSINVKKNISKEQLKELKSSLASLKNQKTISLNKINTDITKTNGEKNNASVIIGNSKIFSPISGIITKKIFKQGEVIGPGTPIIEISDNKNLIIKIFVNEDNLKYIKLNDTLDITLETKNKKINGTIKNIYPNKNTITKKSTIEVSIKDNIKIGSMAKVYFNKNIENSNKNILIPNSSIIERFMLPGVYILENNIAKFKNVQIIKQGDNYSEIVGLDIGDVVIVQGKDNIYDGEILKNNIK